uniref:Uncharacterized protein n=1 Tax=Romanomermis culicivorax TaxID=13658 RepID=A0A915HYV0_ROMCU
MGRRDDEIVEKNCVKQSIKDQIEKRAASDFDCQIMQNSDDSIKNQHLQANFDTNRIDFEENFAQKENQEYVKSANAVKYGERLFKNSESLNYSYSLLMRILRAKINSMIDIKCNLLSSSKNMMQFRMIL